MTAAARTDDGKEKQEEGEGKKSSRSCFSAFSFGAHLLFVPIVSVCFSVWDLFDLVVGCGFVLDCSQ